MINNECKKLKINILNITSSYISIIWNCKKIISTLKNMFISIKNNMLIESVQKNNIINFLSNKINNNSFSILSKELDGNLFISLLFKNGTIQEFDINQEELKLLKTAIFYNNGIVNFLNQKELLNKLYRSGLLCVSKNKDNVIIVNKVLKSILLSKENAGNIITTESMKNDFKHYECSKDVSSFSWAV